MRVAGVGDHGRRVREVAAVGRFVLREPVSPLLRRPFPGQSEQHFQARIFLFPHPGCGRCPFSAAGRDPLYGALVGSAPFPRNPP